MRCLRRFRSLAWAFKCWAACSALCRHPAGRSRGPELGGSAPTVSKSTVFRRGFLTNISNPKSALFFGSVFLEPFPAAPGVALQVSAVAMIVVNALCWHTLLAYFFCDRACGPAMRGHAAPPTGWRLHCSVRWVWGCWCPRFPRRSLERLEAGVGPAGEYWRRRVGRRQRDHLPGCIRSDAVIGAGSVAEGMFAAVNSCWVIRQVQVLLFTFNQTTGCAASFSLNQMPSTLSRESVSPSRPRPARPVFLLKWDTSSYT